MIRNIKKVGLAMTHQLRCFLALLFYSIVLCNPVDSVAETQMKKNTTPLSFSFFGETGETESVFTIAGRNFPVRVGSVGLKAALNPNQNVTFYSRIGIGYSQKQRVSAFNFNVSGSVFATSVGAGLSGEYRIRNSGFVVAPFADFNLYNYSSDTFRGTKDGNQLKANVRGRSSFLRGGMEIRYLTQNGHLFFGGGSNRWNVENRLTIVEGNLSITPRVWADNTDTFFQTGAMFETGSGKAVIGARMSDLTHEINTQLVEFFAEIAVDFN